ncbi:MAG: decaprenyl-phosphate phosphoribosyltransferase [Streptosporangiaceae bacterium]|jgi:decaprenyl-phosphate phosphoribosyltransferase
MTLPSPAGTAETGRVGESRLPGPIRWIRAAVYTARPRQWPKNLLVFAAPLAGATLGRDDGFLYALVAMAAFIAASSAVYYVNDVVDVERDRRHPYKRNRPVASGDLPVPQALVLAVLCAVIGLGAGVWIHEPGLVGAIGAYLALSLLYSLVLKHVPVVEVMFVASGFVLRALGGAAATHVQPSGWFLLVCSLGALLVALAKRYTELTVLGDQAVRHRPVMRWYTAPAVRIGQRVVAVAMLVAYLLWAKGEHGTWLRAWHLASVVPLTAAMLRFDKLTARATSKPVEDLIARDGIMVAFELAWLAMFAAGILMVGSS